MNRSDLGSGETEPSIFDLFPLEQKTRITAIYVLSFDVRERFSQKNSIPSSLSARRLFSRNRRRSATPADTANRPRAARAPAAPRSATTAASTPASTSRTLPSATLGMPMTSRPILPSPTSCWTSSDGRRRTSGAPTPSLQSHPRRKAPLRDPTSPWATAGWGPLTTTASSQAGRVPNASSSTCPRLAAATGWRPWAATSHSIKPRTG